jgi:hypothetical protein
MTPVLSDTFRASLLKAAQRAAHTDREDFLPDDAAGGNIDDAFYAGQADGKTLLARKVLTELGIPFIIET